MVSSFKNTRLTELLTEMLETVAMTIGVNDAVENNHNVYTAEEGKE